MSEISRLIIEVDGQTVKKELSKNGKYSLNLKDGTIVDLTLSLLVFKEELPDNLIASDSPYGKIYLDTTRTAELLAESLAKEFLRRTQIMRKEMNLRVEEYVDIVIQVQDEETAVTLTYVKDLLMIEIRAKNLIITTKLTHKPPEEAYIKEWEIDGETITIAITRLKE
jgi:isoleucyl-tRNA synthetase